MTNTAKKTRLQKAGIKVYSPIDSLFTKGGTMNENYIIIANSKIGLSDIHVYNRYAFSGQIIDSALYAIINDILFVAIDDTSFTRKIKRSSEFSYKFLKTIVKAADGATGLEKLFAKAAEYNHPLNDYLFGTLKQVASL
jgi:hypothetical protein